MHEMMKYYTMDRTGHGLHNFVGVGSGLMKREKEKEFLIRPVQHQLKSHMFVLLHYDRWWYTVFPQMFSKTFSE